jgi:hypothetical protein
MILAVARIPDRPDARAQAARLAGMALADVNRRLAGVLPRVLLPVLPPEAAETLPAALEELGFVTVVFDGKAVPGDGDRVLPARLDIRGRELHATDPQGRAHVCPASALAVLQWGVRVATTSAAVKSKDRRPSLGRALLTGGLVISKTVEKTTVKVEETREPFLLVQRRDGEPDLMLYERRLDYRFLGADMQPTSRANLERVAARLQALAPGLAVDDRAARPGFTAGLPLSSADPADVALYLITLARARGA